MSTPRYGLRPRKALVVARKRSFIETDDDPDDEDYKVSRSDSKDGSPSGDSPHLSPSEDGNDDPSSDLSSLPSDEEDDSESLSSNDEPSSDDHTQDDDFIVPDEDIDVEDDDQYNLDTSMLSSIIERKIRAKFPDIDEAELKDGVRKALKSANTSLISEYCGAVPKDERWKIHTSPEEVEILEPILQETREKIGREEPTMARILATKMTVETRKKMVQLFDIYSNTEPYTYEHYVRRSELVDMLEEIQRADIDVDQEEGLLEKEKALLKAVPPTDPAALKRRILMLGADDIVKGRLLEMYRLFESMPPDSEAKTTLRTKIEWAVALPYGKIVLPAVEHGVSTAQQINAYCVQIRENLDRDLYGMDRVKEELIEMFNDRITNPSSQASLALKGPPGVGKTAIVAALARAVGLPFERIALGGMEDPSIFKGSDSHWIGSGPSIILQLLKRMKIANGILFLDEIDKLGDSPRGIDIQNALLHITDYTQNSQFSDAFLSEFPHDISKIMFVYAMNTDQWLSPILRDRLTIVEVEPYTQKELKEIIKKHLLPRALEKVGMGAADLTIDDSGCDAILKIVGRGNGGVRPVERIVSKIVSRINLLRTNTLEDGSIGRLKLRYTIPGFALPMVVTGGVVEILIEKPKVEEIPSFYS